ncbi:MAG: pseudouridine synthase [Clostridia bacterium BRH_c25]|nr:MAG: pseudouridine synthase [Clostridia bacterium BRH_c25]
MTERLQKVMSEFGVASRRKCEELIAEGKVKVNGRLITEQGCRIDKEKDTIEVDGRIVKSPDTKLYILLNKPTGYITSAKDQFGRPTVLDLVKGVSIRVFPIGRTVLDLVKGVSIRVFPIGRLDYDTEGLIILTNDGDLTYRITHPKHNIEKTYRALVRGEMNKDDIVAFAGGMAIEDYVTAPARLEIVRKRGNSSIVDITIHEGKNRQVRKMCSAAGHEVIRLKRIKIGKIGLGSLKAGEWRYLDESEIKYLKTLGGF